ncbi:VOC family protein [Marinomonas sp. IMCC 4694]|uniref:VOC family protein n=1 Tax=Marinomonas sp. IMCC 4694 TaxID=2605432 RepID=UPI0011E6EE76|nr:VOC family protein [Marinomonas sp. IMCC 4694]TYL47623.1 VOC family protein [Marinomonas sp. IMCC 4694]
MQSNKINYVELPARNLALNKVFFSQVFGWEFIDYGSEYAAFQNAGLEGGFFQADFCSRPQTGAALVILFSDDLETTLANVKAAGGGIEQEIFEFPGGRRFHFTDPCGNEWAVWGKLPG